MKNKAYFLTAASFLISVSGLAQNSNQSMNNTMLMNRQQTAAAMQSMNFGRSLMSNHSKFFAPKQKELDLFRRLSVNNAKKIEELEAEIAEKQSSLESSDNAEKIQKQIKRKEFWLKIARKEKIKFETAITQLEAEIAASENALNK
ncbi:hypothetical protein OMO38_10565 [Chryseobacterium sp. 09-1422]|uniref:Uncharacterized protein n=1 Tax=Chryseobacterium kimseyorum TaxID=2984028 RepID=A0ABT3HZ43_9FLAO|nr:hypothetical protein [Chryseobacterium kimseyorum]MCW3168965.1 hypothetical protein [Chryseobacterium kimseyorum]